MQDKGLLQWQTYQKPMLRKPDRKDHTPDTKSPTSIDVKAAARMCAYTYDRNSISLIEDWYEITPGEIDYWFGPGFCNKLVRNRSGFSSKLFRKQGAGFSYFAFCTEGTCMTSLKDWFSNITQFLCGLAPQYTYSVQLAKEIDKKLGEDHVLWFIGHSLGGGLASNNALICPLRHAITFDAAGLSFLRVFMSSLLNRPLNLLHPIKRNERVHAFVLKNEILNLLLTPLFQGAYGRKQIIEPILSRGRSSLDKHDLMCIIEEIEAKSRISSRYYQVKIEDYKKDHS